MKSLTAQQRLVLEAASLTEPIYAENPSMMHLQMPNKRYPQPLRTVSSLEQRGLLRNDGRGGYLLTVDGQRALGR